MLAGLYSKHTCSRDAARSLICGTEWFKAWIQCHPQKPLSSLSLSHNQLSCSFSRHVTHSLLSLSLLLCLWDIDITWVISGTEVHLWELYFRHTGEGTRIHSSFVTGGYFQSRSHDMTIGTHAHPCWHHPHSALCVLTARLEPNCMHLSVFKL